MHIKYTKKCGLVLFFCHLAFISAGLMPSAFAANVEVLDQNKQRALMEQHYQTYCVSCHGDLGQGIVMLKAPALAGQQVDYLKRQLVNFSSGLRGSKQGDELGAQMRAVATVFSDDQQAQAMAEFLATRPVKLNGSSSNNTTSKTNAQRGETYYQGYCGSCHGAKAQGNDLLFSPRLNNLDAGYLLGQYQKFLTGLRGYDKHDKYGRQMGMIANNLKDPAVIEDVISYIVSQRSAASN